MFKEKVKNIQKILLKINKLNNSDKILDLIRYFTKFK